MAHKMPRINTTAIILSAQHTSTMSASTYTRAPSPLYMRNLDESRIMLGVRVPFYRPYFHKCVMFGGQQITTFLQTSSHHTDTTPTPQPHHIHATIAPHFFFKSMLQVWCSRGVDVVSLVWMRCWCGVQCGVVCHLWATVRMHVPPYILTHLGTCV